MAETLDPEDRAATEEPLPLRTFDLRDSDVPVVDAATLKANWRGMSAAPDIALGTVIRSILLAHAMRDPGFRKHWCDAETGEPLEAVLQAAAVMRFKFSGRKTLNERVKRLQNLACKVKAGKSTGSPVILTPELAAQMERDIEQQFGTDLGEPIDFECLDKLFEPLGG
jgi:hypothetical protein